MRPLLRLVGLMRGQAGWLVLALLLSALAMAANVVLLAVSGWFITGMALAGIAQVGINYFTPAAIIRACAILRTGGRYAERVVGHEATLRFVAALRPRLFAAIARSTPAALSRHDSGTLLNRLKGDIDSLELAFLRILSPLVASLLVLLPALVVLNLLAPALAPVVALTLFASGVLLPLALTRASAPIAQRLPQESDILSRHLIEAVQGASELAVFDPQRRHRAATLAAGEDVLRSEDALHASAGLGTTGVTLAGGLAIIAALLAGLQDAAPRGPDLALCAFLTLAIFDVALVLPPAIQALPGVIAASSRLFELLDRTRVCAVPPGGDAREVTGIELNLDSVCFTYPGAARATLRDISLTLRPGERVALIGASGSGKSTLGALLVRLIEPDAGTLALGGTDYRQLDPVLVRRKIAFMAQDAYLFADTIRNNLLQARPDATEADLRQACRTACILPFIETLPAGFDTFVGAHGNALSGGQARRVALARTLLTGAPILVLDEATEGLDEKTELEVLTALSQTHPACAIVFITHRAACLDHVDRSFRLEHGRLIEAGAGPSRV